MKMLEDKTYKLGLALSGGGFRAGFFHIGVLSRMADIGLLRHVDLISAVSGGSIIGTLYYLRLKKLYESKKGAEVKDEDYQNMMVEIQNDFLRAVQCNIRLRTFTNPLKNLKMCLPNYSRSDYAGELFEKFMFKPVGAFCECKRCIYMHDLTINTTIKNAKIPKLLMNATVLKNGHNWVFTNSGMGEIDRDKSLLFVDGNFKLERVKSYQDLCKSNCHSRCEEQNKRKRGPCKHSCFRLGHAVAASASVPGVFVPLAISDLYEEGIRVQLADGGVHDNQGISTLLSERPKCTHFIISDASKQMESEKEPSTHIPGVVGRSASILADLVREKQISGHMKKYHRTTALLHLKKRLSIDSIPIKNQERQGCSFKGPYHTYGVNEEVQNLLSKVRTDLDSFSEVEAYSLMLDGYKMSEYEFKRSQIKDLAAKSPIKPKNYRFFEIDSWLTAEEIHPYYKRLLTASSKTLFKPFRINRGLGNIGILVAVFIGIMLMPNIEIPSNISLPTVLFILPILYVLLLKAIYTGRLRNPAIKILFKIVPAVLIALTGFIFVNMYLLVFDKLFLYFGSMQKLKRKA
ncbi:patatin-like phospholipase family protein [Bacillus paralicheniformis]|jgi:NTE family protein|nr:patatin-like phospholipase family protein [Bacillus paralicheniformis]QFY39276.1 patatin-like phospholipase family protein [Bacillus paralicheniformis]TJW27170.1 patatin-like phospholipase family protein [Bacillus paralicheniformis]